MLLRAIRGPQTREALTLPGRTPWSNNLTGPIRVDEAQVLALPAANRCVSLISDTIAGLPMHAYRGDDKIDTPTLLENPSPGFTRMEFVAQMVVSLLMSGNSYSLIAERDYLGHPTALVPISPAAVTVTLTSGGGILYRIGGRQYDPDDILHIRGLSLPGELTGSGVVTMQRRTVAQSVAAEDYSGELWSTGSVPDGFLKTDTEMTADEAADMGDRFIQKMGGRQRRPPVLSGGVTYQALAWSNVDLEMLESRKWNAVTVCQIFGVPPIFAMVPSGESKTYQNVQQDWTALVRGTLRGWMTRIEEGFAGILPRGQHALFNLDAVLRADTKERYEAHAIGLAAGFLDVPEVRAMENLDPNITPKGPPDAEPIPEPEPAEDD